MFKLLAMLVMFLLVAMGLSGLRQHRLELTSQSARIYDEIRDRRHTLLDQRVQIARQTNPWTIATALKDAGVNTGDALRPRVRSTSGPAVPAVETDLLAPLMGDGSGHNNPNRPR